MSTIYKDIKNDGTVGKQEQTILEVLKRTTPLSLREIKDRTNIDINAVSGRVNGLKHKGLVEECDKRPCSISKRLITPVRAVKFH